MKADGAISQSAIVMELYRSSSETSCESMIFHVLRLLSISFRTALSDVVQMRAFAR